jgi:hypothetical protein
MFSSMRWPHLSTSSAFAASLASISISIATNETRRATRAVRALPRLLGHAREGRAPPQSSQNIACKPASETRVVDYTFRASLLRSSPLEDLLDLVREIVQRNGCRQALAQ